MKNYKHTESRGGKSKIYDDKALKTLIEELEKTDKLYFKDIYKMDIGNPLALKSRAIKLGHNVRVKSKKKSTNPFAHDNDKVYWLHLEQ